MLCVTNDDPVVEEAHLRVLQEERVAGIVVVPSPRAPRSGSPRPWHETRLSMPIVELVRHRTPPEADAVLIDDVDAGRQGTRHLVGLGHRRIAVLSGPLTLNTSQQRLAGYRQALEEAALPLDNSLIGSGPYRREAARLATRHLLEGRAQPTALIATSNELVVGALQALAERQVRVPDDLSLVGFGNPDWFALLRPALTTVALPIGEMATVAVQLLLKHIGTAHGAPADGDAPPIISRFQAHLIVRDSTRALNGP
jgi:DNA-binding LacI/PurR family transcriptional regulator